MGILKFVETRDCRIAYEESGQYGGTPVILLHGFPYDIRAFDEVTRILVQSNCWIITPYLRGYGPTSFLSPQTMRSGQQAALASDLLALMDALAIPRAVLAGHDWGGRAACIVSALWPARVIGLVTGSGYNIQNIPASIDPKEPDLEFRNWYQYYFHGERGRTGLTKYRKELCKLLWTLWSPTWDPDDRTYAQTAASFDNPDFVAVVIHSYRHRYMLAPGDPQFEDIEQQLVRQPKITVPSISIDGECDGVEPLTSDDPATPFFTGQYERRIFPGIGHNLPQEAPESFAAAVLSFVV